MKPNAQIKSISVCKSGDIKIIAQSPHDENILRQEWPQEKHGRLKPRLPKENTANQEVIIRNIPSTITVSEIREHLRELFIDPKDIYRFNKKGSQDPSNNVKVTVGSKVEKEHLLNNGLGMYNHHFWIVEGQALPKIIQCFKCQKFGHNFFECKVETSTCVRCSGSHRLGECTEKKESAKCSNCAGNHAASYKGCSHYKEEIKRAKVTELQSGQGSKQKSYAKVASASAQQTGNSVDTISLLGCLAECLSELISHINESIKAGKEPDELKPFSIISNAAARHLNIDIHVNDLYVRGLCPSPPKGNAPSVNASAGKQNLQESGQDSSSST